MPHAFQGAIIPSKCQDLICDSVMWTHGREEGVIQLLRSADVGGGGHHNSRGKGLFGLK